MEQDTVRYDSTGGRPLPQWLIKQREGLNTYVPEKITMKEDRSLQTSFIFSGLFILLIISVLTIVVLRKSRKS